ncbi:MAG: exopolysaccharide biosynthesis polyprenyl glycosylphosphotransferase [Novosphingobium sp.]
MNAEGHIQINSHLVQRHDITNLSARDKRAVLYALSLFFDGLSLIGGYILAEGVREGEWLDVRGHAIFVLAIPVFIMLAIAREVQSVETLESRSLAMRRALGVLGGTAFAILGLSFLAKTEDLSRLGFAIMFGSAGCLIIANKFLIDFIFHRWMKGAATASILLLDGMTARAEPHVEVLDLRQHGLHPDLAKPAVMDMLSRIIAPYDRVIVSCQAEDRATWATFLQGHDVGGEILVDRDLLKGAVAIGQYEHWDTLVLSRGPLSLVNRLQKRIFDLVVGAGALLFFAPLMLIAAILIKLESPGPVFFRQVRVGQGNRQFWIYKFRSMRIDSTDQDGNLSTRRDDDRITRVGRFIRRTSIDELPQLINVLLGDMSIVGPRPHALGSLAGEDLFWEVTARYWTRHALKPGITGLAQIRGLRGATSTAQDLEQRIRADLEYLATWSIANDVLILLRTVRVIIHRNAY